ncbi:MAG: SHOCT domain-containing protein [Acidobacteriota bacterium]|nr:SHOCT domain-containing protein [Acidobacteriota bacterium]
MGSMVWLLGYAIGMILIVLAVIILVFQRASRMPPEEIVRRRYARGEIDREQYEQMLEALQVDTGRAPR